MRVSATSSGTPGRGQASGSCGGCGVWKPPSGGRHDAKESTSDLVDSDAIDSLIESSLWIWRQAYGGRDDLSNAGAPYLRLFFLPFLNSTAVLAGLRATSPRGRRGSPRINLVADRPIG